MYRSNQHRQTDVIKLPKVGFDFSWLQQVEMPTLDKMVLEARSSASSLKKGKKYFKKDLKIEKD